MMTKQATDRPIKTNQRRALIVDPQFQFGFSVIMTLICIFTFNFLIVIGYVFYSPLQYAGFTFAHAAIIIAVELVLVTASTLLSLWGSKRISGPVQGTLRAMRDLSQGNLATRLSIREGEYFIGLISGFNDGITELEGRIRGIKQAAAELELAYTREEDLRPAIATLNERLNAIQISAPTLNDPLS